ncbi:MAG: hypothetical protein EHM68_16270 [Lysobacterales bacterium]|nr:MAG: hypothetical protein EHM68_16270 [Xanthomonadales bacterium]
MTFRKFASLPVASLLLGGLLGAADVRAAEVDYVGFAWETGGLAASLPGDQLSIATVVTQIDPLFGVDLNAVEATLHIEGLVSQGSFVDPSTGATTITYAGGTIAILADAARNHDWGTNPANATVPGTFTDGDLVFSGVFTGFVVSLLPSGAGIFEGYIDGTGGSALAGPCASCAYTFAGTFAAPTGAQIPEGYDLQVDGVLEVESAVGTETLNWGSLKQLFNPGR